MFSLFPILALLSATLLASPTPESYNPAYSNHLVTRQCGIAEWDSSNLANWDAADTDATFESWWKFYLGGNGPSTSAVIPNGWENNFANLFGRMYLNAREVYYCSRTDDTCYGDIPCDEVQCSGEWIVGCEDHDHGRPIYLVMRSLQGFQDYFKEYIQVLDETQINFEGMRAYLANSFFPKPDQASALFIREFFSALASVFSITGAYAKLIPIIAGNNVAKETSGAIASLLGGIGNGYRETVRFPSDLAFNDFANLGTFMANIFEKVRATLNDMQFNLALGKPWNGKFFYEYAKGGAFLPGRGASAGTPGGLIDSPAKTLRQYLTRQFNARVINYIWRTQKIFITYTTNVVGSCEQDRQGPQDMKYCRPGDLGVYYMYYWHQKSVGAGTTIGIDSFDTGKMDYPTGWDKLAAGWVEEGYQLDMKDVFESSIAAYQAGGLNYDGETATQRALEAVRDQWANPWDKGTQWEGTFTIPICNTGNTSYNVQYGERIMPCNCGGNGDGSQVADFKKNANMEGYGVYDEQCTDEKIRDREQSQHGGGKGNFPTTTPELPGDVNKVACIREDSPLKPMMGHILRCLEAIKTLGDDMNKQICTKGCADGGESPNSRWCRVAVDKSNIHSCALTLAHKKNQDDFTCISVGDANGFALQAQEVVEKGGSGCHPAGTPNFAATFVTPDLNTRWCLSSYDHPDWCTI